MKFKTIVLLALIIVCNLNFSAYSQPTIDTLLIHKECLRLLKDDNALRFNKFFESTVFLNDSVAYYNPNGSLHLFKIKFDTTTKVSLIRKSPFNGHNFNRHLFIYKGNIFSLGGTGLFSTSTALIKFNFEKNQWYKLKILNVPKGITNVISSWVYQNKIYVCYKIESQDSFFSYGTINLNNYEYEELSRFSSDKSMALIQKSKTQEGFNQGRIISVSENYMVLQSKSSFSKCNYEIFDLKKGVFLELSFLLDLDCISGKSYVYVNDSSVFYRNEKGITVSKNVKDCEIVGSKNFSKFYLSKSIPKKKNDFVVYVISIILLVIILLFFKKLKTKKNNSLAPLINKIKKYKKQSLSRDKLDEILEINHLQPDSLKTKRSYLINEINKSSRITIERVRDKNDKRYYNYLIN